MANKPQPMWKQDEGGAVECPQTCLTNKVGKAKKSILIEMTDQKSPTTRSPKKATQPERAAPTSPPDEAGSPKSMQPLCSRMPWRKLWGHCDTTAPAVCSVHTTHLLSHTMQRWYHKGALCSHTPMDQLRDGTSSVEGQERTDPHTASLS